MGRRHIDKVYELKGRQLKEGTAKIRRNGGAGRLTQSATKTIHGHYSDGHYSGAVRDHPGDVDAMRETI